MPDRPVTQGGQITLGAAVERSLAKSKTFTRVWKGILALNLATVLALIAGLLFLRAQNQDLRDRLGHAADTASHQRHTIDNLVAANETNTQFFCVVRTELVLSIQSSGDPRSRTPLAQQLLAQLNAVPLDCK